MGHSLKPYYTNQGIDIYHGNCLQVLKELPTESVHCVVTSPPYWGLRDYGTDGQLGLEETPEQHVAKMLEVFSEVRRVLRTDGTLWLNYGDTYAVGSANPSGKHSAPNVGVPRRVKNLKPKDLCGIPWRVAFALQADGWWLRQDIIWHKPNPMPESVTDRCTKAHEYIFLLSKNKKYYFDHKAIKEPAAKKIGGAPRVFGSKSQIGTNRTDYKNHFVDNGVRNKRSVWTVAVYPFKGAHFATFPPKLIEPCIKAGCPEGGTVLDPFSGSGTTGEVAQKNGCKFIGIELNEEYIALSIQRFSQKAIF